MRAWIWMVSAVLFVFNIPIKIWVVMQYLWALFFYKKMTLTLDMKFRIGRHVIADHTNMKLIVLWTIKENRGKCPPWYKTYVAIKPCKS